MKKLLDLGTLIFSKDGEYTSLVFEPNEDNLPGKEASVLIKRDTADECIKVLEHYLLEDERPWQEIPATFFDPTYSSDEE